MRFLRVLMTVAAIVMVAGCSGGASVAQATGDVAKFHNLLGAGKYAAIWADAAPEMRNATTEAQLTALLTAVNTKLGKATKSEQVGWRQTVNTGGSFVEVNMNTSFEKGNGTENFVFRFEGDALKLAGWHIQSNELITN